MSRAMRHSGQMRRFMGVFMVVLGAWLSPGAWADAGDDARQLAEANRIYLVNKDYSTLRSLAEQGNAFAALMMERACRLGVLGTVSVSDAERWRDKALVADVESRLSALATGGDALARTWMGRLYDNSLLGKRSDKPKAVAWYRQAAEQGDAPAQNNLATMYFNGAGVTLDYDQALFWYRKSAAQGNAFAQGNLGVAYRDGKGVPPDPVQAVAWFRKAAEGGMAAAQKNLGELYRDGRGVSQDFVQARNWFEKAAAQGDADAQNALGDFYYDGKPGIPRDKQRSVTYYRQAAENGNAAGQYSLGFAYARGDGTGKNSAEALKWLTQASRQGNASAQDEIGNMMWAGNGVELDKAGALVWYQRAASAGNVHAQEMLGSAYFSGEVVTRDLAQAKTWWEKAAAHGSADARKNLEVLAQQGTTDLVTLADKVLSVMTALPLRLGMGIDQIESLCANKGYTTERLSPAGATALRITGVKVSGYSSAIVLLFDANLALRYAKQALSKDESHGLDREKLAAVSQEYQAGLESTIGSRAAATVKTFKVIGPDIQYTRIDVSRKTLGEAFGKYQEFSRQHPDDSNIELLFDWSKYPPKASLTLSATRLEVVVSR